MVIQTIINPSVFVINVRSKYSEIRCHYVASRSVTQLSTERLGNYTVIGLESRGVSKIDVCVPLQQVLALGPFGGCVWYRNARFYLDTKWYSKWNRNTQLMSTARLEKLIFARLVKKCLVLSRPESSLLCSPRVNTRSSENCRTGQRTNALYYARECICGDSDTKDLFRNSLLLLWNTKSFPPLRARRCAYFYSNNMRWSTEVRSSLVMWSEMKRWEI